MSRERLSPREREVLELLAQGFAVKQVAGRLTLSSHTVSTHSRAILRKLEARNRAHAVAIALRTGVLP